jgi:hypothetical protein
MAIEVRIQRYRQRLRQHSYGRGGIQAGSAAGSARQHLFPARFVGRRHSRISDRWLDQHMKTQAKEWKGTEMIKATRSAAATSGDRIGRDGRSSSGSTSEPTAARQSCRAAARRSSSRRSSLEAGWGDRQPGSIYAFVSRDPLSRTRPGDPGGGS